MDVVELRTIADRYRQNRERFIDLGTRWVTVRQGYLILIGSQPAQDGYPWRRAPAKKP